MSCILRVFGDALNVEALLTQLALEPDRVWRKGDPRFKSKPNGEVLNNSGASFMASEAEMFEFNIQAEEASAFLEKHRLDIRKMVDYPGVDGVVLDFGVELRDVAIHSDYLSPKLIQAAAQAGIGVELSHYPFSKENES